jgi:hypothetical protein
MVYDREFEVALLGIVADSRRIVLALCWITRPYLFG